MTDRPRREVRKHGQAKASGALAQLAELRRGGKKHADLYELKEENDVYETMGEDEYAQFVSKRREAGGMQSALANEAQIIVFTAGDLSNKVNVMLASMHQAAAEENCLSGDFVVEDGIEGYKDLGEEEDWTVEEEVEPENGAKGNKKDANKEENHKGTHEAFMTPVSCGLQCGH